MDHARRTPDRGAETAGKGPPLRQPDVPPLPATSQATDSARLNALARRKPIRKSAQIRWLWPEISETLAAGHTIGDVRRELALAGLEISYSKLRTHIGRLRKAPQSKPAHNCDMDSPTGVLDAAPAGSRPSVRPVGPTSTSVNAAQYDPLANLRDRLTRRPGFKYDDRPPDEKKLI
jgi:hypothetical protein